jgi:hypothetical protein
MAFAVTDGPSCDSMAAMVEGFVAMRVLQTPDRLGTLQANPTPVSLVATYSMRLPPKRNERTDTPLLNQPNELGPSFWLNETKFDAYTICNYSAPGGANVWPDRSAA